MSVNRCPALWAWSSLPTNSQALRLWSALHKRDYAEALIMCSGGPTGIPSLMPRLGEQLASAA